MEMILDIADKNMSLIGVLDSFSSFLWIERYAVNGDFEICTEISDRNMHLLAEGNYIIRSDSENVGIIEAVKSETDENGRNIMIVSGGFLPALLKRRIIEKQTVVSGTLSEGIKKLIVENAVNPNNRKRRIPGFTVKDTYYSEKLEAQYTGKNLLDTIEETCTSYDTGFKCTVSSSHEAVFELYRGIDRSYGQDKNTFVVFSEEYDNLISANFEKKYNEQVTDVLVAGEGEGLERKTIWTNNGEKEGISRYEVYLDRRNMSTNEGEINDADYYNQLTQEGKANINVITGIFTGTAVFSENIKYRKNVYVGDICTIENKKWGIYTNSRLLEVVESIDEAGKYTVNPAFDM